MSQPRRFTLSAALVVTLAVPLFSGCRIESNKNGKNEDVHIATPFGDMQVKTNDKAAETGLPLYPGAVVLRKEKGDDSGAADVNMSFGAFRLRVKAASYSTPDSPDKVLDYYRSRLGSYGTVIECNHGKLVSGTITADSPRCSDEASKGVDAGDEKEHELRAGSRQHQRIVGVSPRDGGRKLGLVVLDLPSGLHINADSEEHQQ